MTKHYVVTAHANEDEYFTECGSPVYESAFVDIEEALDWIKTMLESGVDSCFICTQIIQDTEMKKF